MCVVCQQSPDSVEAEPALLSPSVHAFAFSCLHVGLFALPGTRQAPGELSLWGPSCRGGGRRQQGEAESPQQERNHEQHGEPYSSQSTGVPCIPSWCPTSPDCCTSPGSKRLSSAFVLTEMKIYTVCQGRANNFNKSWSYLCFLDLFVVVV